MSETTRFLLENGYPEFEERKPLGKVLVDKKPRDWVAETGKSKRATKKKRRGRKHGR